MALDDRARGLGWRAFMARVLCVGSLAAAVWTRRAFHEQGLLGIASYWETGDKLIQGSPGASSYHLPLASILGALLASQWTAAPVVGAAVYVLLAAALLLALERLLGFSVRSTSGAVAAAIALATMVLWWQYPQDVLGLFMLLVACLMAWRAQAPGSTPVLWGLALAIGTSFLFRSTLVFLPPLLVLWEVCRRSSGPRRAALRKAAVLLVVPYLFLLPWAAMNWILHRRIILFEDGQANCNIVTGALGLVGTIEGSWGALIDAPARSMTLTEVVAWSMATVRLHPLRYAAAVTARIAWAFLWLAPFSALAAAALWSGRREKRVQALGLLAAYYLGIHSFMSIEWRYVMPLRPLLVVLSATWLARRSRAPEPVRPGSAGTVVGAALAGALALASFTILLCLRYPARSARPASEQRETWAPFTRGDDRLECVRIPGLGVDWSRCRPLKPYRRFEIDWRRASAEVFAGRLDPQRTLLAPTTSPERAQEHLLRARVWLGLGQSAKAEQEMKAASDELELRAFVRGPQDAEAQRALGKLLAADVGSFYHHFNLLLAGWPNSELDAMTSLMVATWPRSLQAWLLRAEFLTRQFSTSLPTSAAVWKKKALPALTQAAGLDPRPEDRRRLIAAYERLGENLLALAQLQRLPADASTLLELRRISAGPADLLRSADANFRAGRARRALQQLRRLPENAQVLIEEGRVYAALSRKEEALSALARARTMAMHADERFKLALVYQDLRRYQDALEILAGLLEKEPKKAEWLNARGVCQYLSGSHAQAASSLEEAMRSAPAFLPPYMTLAALRVEQGRRREAVALLERALTIAPRADVGAQRERLEEMLGRLRSDERPPRP